MAGSPALVAVTVPTLAIVAMAVLAFHAPVAVPLTLNIIIKFTSIVNSQVIINLIIYLYLNIFVEFIFIILKSFFDHKISAEVLKGLGNF